MAGDSSAGSWKEAFTKVHENCNISATYRHIGHPGSLLFPVAFQKSPNRDMRTLTSPNEPATRLLDTVQKLKPNITLLFSETMHVCEFSLNKSAPLVNARKNLEKWKILIRTAIPQLIEALLPYTTPGD